MPYALGLVDGDQLQKIILRYTFLKELKGSDFFVQEYQYGLYSEMKVTQEITMPF